MEEIAWPTEPDWHLGVTGSRKRFDGAFWYPSTRQTDALRTLLHRAAEHGAKYLHHGVCTGWDEAAVNIVVVDKLDLLIYAYPPVQERYMSSTAFAFSHVIHKPREYRERNQDIVNTLDLLFAGPQWPEGDARSARSGTWQTVRMARRANVRVYASDQLGNITDVTEAQ